MQECSGLPLCPKLLGQFFQDYQDFQVSFLFFEVFEARRRGGTLEDTVYTNVILSFFALCMGISVPVSVATCLYICPFTQGAGDCSVANPH